jgi:hypothetical protein
MSPFNFSGNAGNLDRRLCEGIDALAAPRRIPPEERDSYQAFSLRYQHFRAAHAVEPDDWIVYLRSETEERIFIVPRNEYPDTHAQALAVGILVSGLVTQPT